MADPEVLDPEDEPTDFIRHPGVPTTIAELARLKGEGHEIIEARIRVLETARKAGIRATHPTDWILFKAKDDQGGQIVGYLQDSGCERVRDIFGIGIENVQAPEKLAGADPNVFHYLVRGDGRCSLTGQLIEGIEGGRSSTDDFCKDKTGAVLELAVRKAARANLDGQIVRELAGLGSVPLAELEAAWTGTHKKVAECRRGRGFGTTQERSGGDNPDAPKNVVPPKCGVCGAIAARRTSARGAFYGCPRFKQHEDRKWTLDEAEWLKNPASRAPEPATAAADAIETRAQAGAGDGAAQSQPPAQTATAARSDEPPPLTDADLDFGGGRGRTRR